MLERVKAGAVRAILQRFGLPDPATVWHAAPPATQRAARAAYAIASTSHQLVPPEPAPELRGAIDAAAAEEGIAPELLQAYSWCVSRYGADPLPGYVGPFHLPARLGVRGSLRDEAVGTARAIRTLQADRGLASALHVLTGSQEIAREIAGTCALLLLASVTSTVPAELRDQVAAVMAE